MFTLLCKACYETWFEQVCKFSSGKALPYEYEHLLFKKRDFTCLEVKEITYQSVFFFHHSIAISLTFTEIKLTKSNTWTASKWVVRD